MNGLREVDGAELRRVSTEHRIVRADDNRWNAGVLSSKCEMEAVVFTELQFGDQQVGSFQDGASVLETFPRQDSIAPRFDPRHERRQQMLAFSDDKDGLTCGQYFLRSRPKR